MHQHYRSTLLIAVALLTCEGAYSQVSILDAIDSISIHHAEVFLISDKSRRLDSYSWSESVRLTDNETILITAVGYHSATFDKNSMPRNGDTVFLNPKATALNGITIIDNAICTRNIEVHGSIVRYKFWGTHAIAIPLNFTCNWQTLSLFGVGLDHISPTDSVGFLVGIFPREDSTLSFTRENLSFRPLRKEGSWFNKRYYINIDSIVRGAEENENIYLILIPVNDIRFNGRFSQDPFRCLEFDISSGKIYQTYIPQTKSWPTIRYSLSNERLNR